MDLTLQWWKNGDDWLRHSRDTLISIVWHKNNSVQLWHALSNMQIHKSTVYKGCSIILWPKVEAKVLYSCNLARVQIYSIDEYTESFEAITFLVFLLQIIKHSYSSKPWKWKKQMDKIRHRVVIPYLCLKVLTSKQVHQDMDATLGEDCPFIQHGKKWDGEFKHGRESPKDDPAQEDCKMPDFGRIFPFSLSKSRRLGTTNWLWLCGPLWDRAGLWNTGFKPCCHQSVYMSLSKILSLKCLILCVSTEHTLLVVAVCVFRSFWLECPVETQPGNKFTECHTATEHPLTTISWGGFCRTALGNCSQQKHKQLLRALPSVAR